MRSRRRLPLALLLALALPAVPATAMSRPAQPTQAAKAAALALADKGWEHFQAGRYEEALAAFRDAYDQVHAPPILRYAARSCERLGRLIEARSLFQRVVDEPLDARAPPEFHEAQAKARVELAALAARIPTLEIAITGVAPSAVELTLDGEPVFQTGPLERDPGEHTVVASVPGQAPVTRTIRLSEGAKERVALVLTPAPAPVTRSAPPSGNVTHAARSDVNMAVLVGGGVATGVGAATGVLFTVLANNRAGDAETQKTTLLAGGRNPCTTRPAPAACTAQSQAVNESQLYSNLAFWSFAGAGVGLGTLLYALVHRPEAPVQVTPAVGMNDVGLSVGGAF
ncbi:tetratricopeptide repeat protein [Sorangium sp. So ce448]|uniref:tetratricopeptide repeat protein n=1 Tax=Sorangium sp. So ce448 TaxID=3133314 RepID=UPI003F63147A